MAFRDARSERFGGPNARQELINRFGGGRSPLQELIAHLQQAGGMHGQPVHFPFPGYHPQGSHVPADVSHPFRAPGSQPGGGQMVPGGAIMPYHGQDEQTSTGLFNPGPGQHVDTGLNPAMYQRSVGNTGQAATDWEAHHPYAMGHGLLPQWLTAFLTQKIRQASGGPGAPGVPGLPGAPVGQPGQAAPPARQPVAY